MTGNGMEKEILPPPAAAVNPHPAVIEGDNGSTLGNTLLNDDAVNVILNHVSRIQDFAVAALDRVEDNPVMQSLLTEIREKAAAIHGLFEK